VVGAWREKSRLDPTAYCCGAKGRCCAEHFEVVVLMSSWGRVERSLTIAGRNLGADTRACGAYFSQ